MGVGYRYMFYGSSYMYYRNLLKLFGPNMGKQFGNERDLSLQST